MNTIMEIIQKHKDSGGHFFDKDTVRFFRSKCYPEVFGNYFITSEISPDEEMRYTIRKFSDLDGSIDTVGQFFSYVNLSDAINDARSLSDFAD